MTDSIRNKITVWSLILLVIIVVGYGVFRIYPFLMGPVITIYYPKDGEEVGTSTFQISGKVERAKEIKLQGRPITINTEGLFTETLVTHSPYTILVIEAVDTYGKKVQTILQVRPQKEVKETGIEVETSE